MPAALNRPQPPFPAQVPSSSGAAITSLVLGILSVAVCLLPLGPIAVVFGHVGLSKIAKSRGQLTGRGMAIAGLVTGYLATVVLAGYAALITYGIKSGMDQVGKPDEPFVVPDLSAVTLPDLGEGELIEDTQVKFHDLAASGSGPAGSTRFRVLVPPGDHADRSLPCVLVAPAGSNLLSGMDLDEGDYFDETLPYAEAGMVVVSYSIDGPMGEDEDDVGAAYEQFRAAGAGVANGALALRLAREKLPFVNPDKIFSVGHSSAGTLSLLLAAHLPDLAGAAAYAPACDVAAFHKDLLDEPFSGLLLPGARVFVKRSSPTTHAARIKVPVFVFGARDDDKVTSEEWRNFGRAVTDAGGQAEIKTVATGGHYQSMIDEGIPAGIEWIRARL
jgi:dienelactone hydrolase